MPKAPRTILPQNDVSSERFLIAALTSWSPRRHHAQFAITLNLDGLGTLIMDQPVQVHRSTGINHGRTNKT